MKSKLILLTLAVLVLSGLNGCKKPDNDILYKRKYIDEIKEARKSIRFFMVQNFIPGANVAVSIDGELVYSEGVGWASKDLEVKAKRNNTFRIGEVSMLYTNAIYHKLVEEGVLIPDSSVQHYFPQFPVKEKGKITLEMLASEVTGIHAPNDDRDLRMINTPIEEGINLFKDDPLDFPPGLFQIPSCYNYNLLGVVMEKATGKRYHQLLDEYVIQPLQLEHTREDNPFATIKGRADFYEPNIIAQVVNTKFCDLRVNAPSKGLLSNAEDLVKLGNAFMEGDYFSEKTRETLFHPLKLYNNNPSRMVNGWRVYKDTHGRIVYGLEGSVVGGSGSLVIYPEQKMVIAYACNLSSAVVTTPVGFIANVFLGTTDEGEQTREKLK